MSNDLYVHVSKLIHKQQCDSRCHTQTLSVVQLANSCDIHSAQLWLQSQSQSDSIDSYTSITTSLCPRKRSYPGRYSRWPPSVSTLWSGGCWTICVRLSRSSRPFCSRSSSHRTYRRWSSDSAIGRVKYGQITTSTDEWHLSDRTSEISGSTSQRSTVIKRGLAFRK